MAKRPLFFGRRRMRQETAFDLTARDLMQRAITPKMTLIASMTVCLFCVWVLVVVLADWPRAWANVFVVVGLYSSPALTVVSLRELWRTGWDVRLFLAVLVSSVGFAFLCAAIYAAIHGNGA